MADSKRNPEDLKRLRKELEKHLDWGTANQWHSSMFKELSEKIYASSSVMLSPATLKRFFGVVNHNGSPSITTLDALSQFIGFENWRGFKLAKTNRLTDWNLNIPRRFSYAVVGSLLVLVTFFLLSNRRSPDTPRPGTLSFSSRVLTHTYPNSVIFDFDVSDLSTDDLRIQQYWDTSKTISIHRNQSQATGIYYFPGYFRAKMVVDGQIVEEHDLFLRSKGWLGTIDYEPVPKYFTPETGADQALEYSQELVEEIADSEDPLVMTYHYINDLGDVSGDNFQLQATLRQTFSEKWAICQSSRIYVLGTEGAMIIPLSKIGCSSDNNLMLNDRYLNGKEHDLSAFSADLEDYTNVELLVENQRVSVRIKGAEVYQAQYQETMGKLVGLRFKFLGMGEVKSFNLLDQQGDVVAF